MSDNSTTKTPKPRGFAAMDSQRQREIASLGGQTAHRLGKAHRFSAEEARAAGAAGHQTRRLQQQQSADAAAQVADQPGEGFAEQSDGASTDASNDVGDAAPGTSDPSGTAKPGRTRG